MYPDSRPHVFRTLGTCQCVPLLNFRMLTPQSCPISCLPVRWRYVVLQRCLFAIGPYIRGVTTQNYPVRFVRKYKLHLQLIIFCFPPSATRFDSDPDRAPGGSGKSSVAYGSRLFPHAHVPTRARGESDPTSAANIRLLLA